MKMPKPIPIRLLMNRKLAEAVARIDGKALKKPASALFADIEKSLGAPLPPLVRVLGDWDIDVNPSSGFVSPAGMVKDRAAVGLCTG